MKSSLFVKRYIHSKFQINRISTLSDQHSNFQIARSDTSGKYEGFDPGSRVYFKVHFGYLLF